MPGDPRRGSKWAPERRNWPIFGVSVQFSAILGRKIAEITKFFCKWPIYKMSNISCRRKSFKISPAVRVPLRPRGTHPTQCQTEISDNFSADFSVISWPIYLICLLNLQFYWTLIDIPRLGFRLAKSRLEIGFGFRFARFRQDLDLVVHVLDKTCVRRAHREIDTHLD